MYRVHKPGRYLKGKGRRKLTTIQPFSTVTLLSEWTNSENGCP